MSEMLLREIGDLFRFCVRDFIREGIGQLLEELFLAGDSQRIHSRPLEV